MLKIAEMKSYSIPKKNKTSKEGVFFVTAFCLLFIFGALKVNASELFFNPAGLRLISGDEFLVKVAINTQGELINAVSGEISFPQNFLEIKEIRDGDSIMNLWLDRPSILKSGAVYFSGIIPGGYRGTNGSIFSIVFRSKNSGEGEIKITNGQALINDGSGTGSSFDSKTFKITILSSSLDSSSRKIVKEISDIEPPEKFKPEITKDPEIFGGKWFLVFATEDKNSGIDHYEVCEGDRDNCTVATSPWLLKNQSRNADISVKAVDKMGNEIIVEVATKAVPFKYPIIIAIILVIVFLAWRFLKK